MSDSTVLSSLETKYKEAFKIISSDLIADTGLYDMRISPLSNENIVFKVDYDPTKNHVNDYYPYAIWQYEGEKYVRSILEETDVPFALQCGVSARIEIDSSNIPSFDELLANHKEDLSLNIFLHLFGKIDEKTVNAQITLDKKLRKLGLKKIGFSTNIYDIASLDGGTITDQKFDFGVSTESSFELDNRDYFLGLMKYRIKSDVENSPTRTELEEILVDNPDSMMFKKL